MVKKWTYKLGVIMSVGVISINIMTGHSISATKKTKPTIHLVAVGDSLTEGIGDTKKMQGYTKRTALQLQRDFNVTVKTANYGKAGDRSDQIEARLKRNKSALKELKQADVITLTVGGNDLQQTLFKAILATSKDHVTKIVNKSTKQYEKKLTRLVAFIKKQNDTAPIFLFGNYNPLYVYLANRHDLNADVKRYNELNASLAQSDPQVYYVSTFNTLTYGQYNTEKKRAVLANDAQQANRGSLTNKEVETTLNGDNSEKNDYITNQDHYHPNNKGYDKMSELLVKKMTAVQKKWLKK